MEDVISADALAAWMDDCGLGSGPIKHLRLLSGGTQNILAHFDRAGRSYILRRPPLHLRENSNSTMRRETQVLAALADTAIPHPPLIAACTDPSILGAEFYLMEPVEGFNAKSGLPALHAESPETRHRMGLAMVEAIASLGMLNYKAVGLDGFGKPENFLGRQVDRWQRQLESYANLEGWPGPAAIPGIDETARWLETHRPPDARPGIVHGDYHIANVMFEPGSGELAAVVDWELATIGDPLIDLGWLMATWPESATESDVVPWEGFPSIDELVAHYSRSSDRDLAHVQWYGVLACYKLGIILEGTHARACAGLAPKETGGRLHAKTLDLFARALRMIRSDTGADGHAPSNSARLTTVKLQG